MCGRPLFANPVTYSVTNIFNISVNMFCLNGGYLTLMKSDELMNC